MLEYLPDCHYHLIHKHKMNLIIRPESEKDYSQIKNINDNAFGQENEGILIEKLRKNKNYVNAISLVAETNDKVVGHILFFPIQIINNENSHESLALAPMAVLPAYQHKGIGSELVDSGLELARTRGYKSVIVLGHRDYYPKFGFEMAKNWNIKAPFEVPNENFMAIELVENGLNYVSGTVKYPDEFTEVS